MPSNILELMNEEELQNRLDFLKQQRAATAEAIERLEREKEAELKLIEAKEEKEQAEERERFIKKHKLRLEYEAQTPKDKQSLIGFEAYLNEHQ